VFRGLKVTVSLVPVPNKGLMTSSSGQQGAPILGTVEGPCRRRPIFPISLEPMLSQQRAHEKRKRMVVYFSPEQRDSLEKYFETWKGDIGPEEKETIAVLATEIGLSPQQIRGWLRNRKLRGAYKGKTVHHPDQIRALEWLYSHHSKYPPTEFKKKLAERLGMTYKQVKKWYQSRRQKSEPSPVVDTEPENLEEWSILLSSLKELVRNSEDDVFFSDPGAKRRRLTEAENNSLSPLSSPQWKEEKNCSIPLVTRPIPMSIFSQDPSGNIMSQPPPPRPLPVLISHPTHPVPPPSLLSPNHQPLLSPSHGNIPQPSGLEGFGSNSLPLPSLSQTLPKTPFPSPRSEETFRTLSFSPRKDGPPSDQLSLPPLHILMRRASATG